MKKNRGNIAILVLLLIVLIIGVVLYIGWRNSNTYCDGPLNVLCTKKETISQVVPTPSIPKALDTSNWKIYRNEKLGFELRLPPSWSVDTNRSNRVRSGSDVVFDYGGPGHEGISVDPAENKSIEDLVNEHNMQYVDEITNITIDGEKGKVVSTTEMGTTYIYVIHNNSIYTFTTGGWFEDEGILTTFKFL